MRPPLFSERHKNQKACERGRESKMSNEIKRIDRKLAYEGAVINVYQDTVPFPDGHTAKWDYIHHDGAAAVIPVLPDGRILMVKQYRNALDRFTLEIPAGKLDDPKEEGIVCASRELEEETGYRCERLEPLLVLRTTVAFCNERIEVFAARDLIPSRQHLDEDEFIELQACTLAELKEKIFSGEIQDSKTVAAILAYAVKYDRE